MNEYPEYVAKIENNSVAKKTKEAEAVAGEIRESRSEIDGVRAAKAEGTPER